MTIRSLTCIASITLLTACTPFKKEGTSGGGICANINHQLTQQQNLNNKILHDGTSHATLLKQYQHYDCASANQ